MHVSKIINYKATVNTIVFLANTCSHSFWHWQQEHISPSQISFSHTGGNHYPHTLHPPIPSLGPNQLIVLQQDVNPTPPVFPASLSKRYPLHPFNFLTFFLLRAVITYGQGCNSTARSQHLHKGSYYSETVELQKFRYRSFTKAIINNWYLHYLRHPPCNSGELLKMGYGILQICFL